jgi:hypothetical protein
MMGPMEHRFSTEVSRAIMFMRRAVHAGGYASDDMDNKAELVAKLESAIDELEALLPESNQEERITRNHQ